MTPTALLLTSRLAGGPLLGRHRDERLVEMVRAGSEQAFEAIVTRYEGPLMRHCSRLLPRERAEDVVQQAFLRAYQVMLSTQGDFELRPWLYRVAHNGAIDVLRDRSLRHSEVDESYDGVERPDEAVERKLEVQDAVAAVKALPDRQRDALVLRELQGDSYDEIATQLGVTGGAVRQLLARARATLRSGASMLTPSAIFARLSTSPAADPAAVRLAEACGAGAGAGAVAVQIGIAALVTGSVAGGMALAPHQAEAPSAAKPPVVGRTADGATAARGNPPRSAAIRSKRSAPLTRRSADVRVPAAPKSITKVAPRPSGVAVGGPLVTALPPAPPAPATPQLPQPDLGRDGMLPSGQAQPQRLAEPESGFEGLSPKGPADQPRPGGAPAPGSDGQAPATDLPGSTGAAAPAGDAVAIPAASG